MAENKEKAKIETAENENAENETLKKGNAKSGTAKSGNYFAGRKDEIIVMLKEAAVLLIITLVAGLCLGFVYELTKEPIAQQEALAVKNACAAVMPGAENYNEISVTLSSSLASELAESGVSIGTVYEATKADGTIMGYVVETVSSEGYGGDIDLYIGVDPYTDPETLVGVSIVSISETAGLGMRAEEVLIPQLNGKQASEFTYTKSGSTSDTEIDAISGATITTKAVTSAVNGGLKAAMEIFESAVEEGRVSLNE